MAAPFPFMLPGETRDTATLIDLIEACSKILSFTETVSEDRFYSDGQLVSAVSYQILIIGEAVKRLSESLRARYPNVPWGEIAGMRDTMIHHYDDVELPEVWNTATVDVPRLLEQLRQIQADRQL